MFGAVMPHALAMNPSARLIVRRRLTRLFSAVGLGCAAALLMACPQKQANTVNYTEAERGLRLAINVNEVAYNSWNKVYESFGELQRNGKISEARWAAVSAIDGVIVLSEADLIEGIERSKKLLEAWRQASAKVLSAESAEEVTQYREREQEARRNFNTSIDYLNTKSIKLRDSYAEAVIIADAVAKDGNLLPAEHISAIRQIVKMVDQEIAKERAKEKGGAVKQPKKESTSPVVSSVK